MRIDTSSKIGGFPLLKIRDLLKRNSYQNVNIVSNFLNVGPDVAAALLDELVKLELVELVNDNHITHQNTVAGNSLALSKAIPSISREKADLIFAEFMQRVKEVNENPYYLYKVKLVLLFGSYITDAPFVNDIDMAIELIQKEEYKENWREVAKKRLSEAREKGVRFGSFLNQLSYPQTEVRLFLKSKSRYLSFHPTDDAILDKTVVRKLYCRCP
jgi:predicted nucleotidyltransferase